MLEILEFVEAHVASVTNRIEKHGDEDKPAVTLRVEITTANTFLDMIDPTLRHALYKPVEGQDQLPGVEPATPVLRCNSFEKLPLATAYEGWRLLVDDGVDDTQPMAFGGVKVDKMTVDAKQGGSVVYSARLGTSDVDAEKLGKLGMLNGGSIWIKLLKPEAKAAAIDGSTEAFKADHPDAGDLFAAEHGDDDSEGDPDEFGEESEGGDADIEAAGSDDQPADPERGENWPFGTNSGADGTNEANGETEGVDSETADFEAGAAAAIAKAGVKPARRGRKVAAE